MRNEILLNAIGDISDDLILSVENVGNIKKHKIIKYVASAACFLLLATVVILNFPQKKAELPMLVVMDNDTAGGFGYEALMAYRISDLTNANPWSEDAKLSTLPVYKNLYTYDVNGKVVGNADEYTERLLKSVSEKTKNMSGIKVEKSLGGMEIDIEFVPEVVLDEKYNFLSYGDSMLIC